MTLDVHTDLNNYDKSLIAPVEKCPDELREFKPPMRSLSR